MYRRAVFQQLASNICAASSLATAASSSRVSFSQPQLGMTRQVLQDIARRTYRLQARRSLQQVGNCVSIYCVCVYVHVHVHVSISVCDVLLRGSTTASLLTPLPSPLPPSLPLSNPTPTPNQLRRTLQNPKIAAPELSTVRAAVSKFAYVLSLKDSSTDRSSGSSVDGGEEEKLPQPTETLDTLKLRHDAYASVR